MQNRYLLWALYLTGFGVAAMAKAFLIGLVYHLQDTLSRLYLALWQQSELRNLGGGK
jgi:hypothetical protein